MFGLSSTDWPSRGAYRWRGVRASTRTSKVDTLRQALQNSSDTSCSSRVDTNQPILLPSASRSHAWARTTAKASRRRLLSAGHVFTGASEAYTRCEYEGTKAPAHILNEVSVPSHQVPERRAHNINASRGVWPCQPDRSAITGALWSSKSGT